MKYTNSSHRNGDESYQSSCREMNDHFGKTIDKICSSVTDGISKITWKLPMHIWRRLCEIYLSFCLSNDRSYFFSGRNIRKKCIVSRKSWYLIFSILTFPESFISRPQIKTWRTHIGLRTFNFFDSRHGPLCLSPAPASTYNEELLNPSCIDAFFSWNSVQLKDHLPCYSCVVQRAFVDLLS